MAISAPARADEIVAEVLQYLMAADALKGWTPMNPRRITDIIFTLRREAMRRGEKPDDIKAVRLAFELMCPVAER